VYVQHPCNCEETVKLTVTVYPGQKKQIGKIVLVSEYTDQIALNGEKTRVKNLMAPFRAK